MILEFYICYLIVFISQLGTVTSDRCQNECVWGSWEPWKCEQCCQVWSGRNAAYRYRSICCSAEPDINSCLKKCNFHQNQTTDNGMCTSYCPCYQQPTVMPLMAWPSKIPVTVTPTPAHPNLPTIYQTRSMARTRIMSVAHVQTTTSPTNQGQQHAEVRTAPPIPQILTSTNAIMARVSSVARIQGTNNPMDKLYSVYRTRRSNSTITVRLPQKGQAVLHLMEFIDGTVTYDRVVSNQLGEDAGGEPSREVKCLTECKGRRDLYNCLVKCILSPCETLVNIAGPCLFVLGVIVGSSITFCITRVLGKNRDKKDQTSVQPIKAALNF